MTRIIAFSGSIRKGSHNAKLAKLVVKRAKAAGADAEYIDLGAYPMPVFDADLETEHHPKCAQDLAKRFAAADGVFVATPEYNGSVTPLLKNTIDWISREKQFPAFKKPVFAVGSASPGHMGAVGARGHLRDILAHLGALIVPMNFGVGQAETAMDEEGELTVQRLSQQLDQMVDQLMTIKRS